MTRPNEPNTRQLRESLESPEMITYQLKSAEELMSMSMQELKEQYSESSATMYSIAGKEPPRDVRLPTRRSDLLNSIEMYQFQIEIGCVIAKEKGIQISGEYSCKDTLNNKKLQEATK